MPEAELHLRTFVADDLTIRDQHGQGILEGYCVPFDVEQDIAAEGIREVFRRGAFSHQTRAAHRLGLYDEHQQDPDHRLGIGRELHEDDHGLWASFKLLETRAQVVRDLVAEGHRGLSIGFKDWFPRTLPGGLVERRRVHLAHVALVPEGAYPGAEVVSIRGQEAPEQHPDTEFWSNVDAWALTRKSAQGHSAGRG